MTTIAESTMSGNGKAGVAGFALPAAVIGVVVVGVLVTGGIQVATQEFRMGMAAERATEAFYVAESGMNTVLADWRPTAAAITAWGAPATVSGSTYQGRWSAEIRQVDTQTYFVRTTGALSSEQGATAQRSVGVLARMLTADLEPPAALMTQGTVRVSGSAQIRGNDLVPGGWGGQCPDPLENLPGVVLDTGGTVELSGGGAVSGTPSGWVTDPSINDESFTQFGDMSWDELIEMANIELPAGNINQMGPSFTAAGACQYSNLLNWGDPANPASACGNYFPIIYVAGSANIQSGGIGQGILLVDGDLSLRGNFSFYGVIITQGTIGVQGGGPRIYGGAFARNADLDVESFVGSSIVQNSRCAINRAVLNNTQLTRLAPIARRSWVDVTGTTF